MNEAPRKSFRIITVVAKVVLALAIVFFIGPSAIHTAYRATTPAATIQSRRADYQRLAEAELGLSGIDLTTSQRARYKLSLWFHARGLNIDEDDEDHPLWHPWTELLSYWRN